MYDLVFELPDSALPKLFREVFTWLCVFWLFGKSIRFLKNR